MGFVIADKRTNIKSAWEAAQVGVDDGGNDSHTVVLTDPIGSNLRYYLKLSYDRNRDRLIISNGDSGNTIDAFAYIEGDYHNTDFDDQNHAYHVAFDADTLDPAKTLVAAEASRWLYPLEGACMQFVTDHTTGAFYGVNGLRYRPHPNTGVQYDQDYGGYPMAIYELKNVINLDEFFAIEYFGTTIMPKDGDVYYNTNLQAVGTVSAQPIVTKGTVGVVMAPPVIMDDIIVFAYASGPIHGGYLYAATLNGDWISSRPIRMSYVLGIAPIGVDRFIVIGSLSGGIIGGVTQPVSVFTYRYDRIRGSVILDDVAGLNTDFEYKFPDHVGFMTFDSLRGTLILLSPDMTTIERHVFDQQCHPIAPTRVLTPVPVQPLHAGRATRFVGSTLKGAGATQSRAISIDYGSQVSAGNFTTYTGQFRTRQRDGAGGFTVGLTSATEGLTLSITATTSSFSTVVSATTGDGSKYGNEHMALQSDTANFQVSASLSAGTSSTVISTSSTIIPRRPILQSDAGGGTPRELEYPAPSPFATPIIYPFNPQQWTDFLGQPLSRPIYKEVKTLGKTVTTELEKNISDVTVVETWLGGGDRLAMPVSFLAALWEYFANPPDVVSQGYIIWRPRDLTASTYKVVIANLEVGGTQNAITFDNLVKQGVGIVHDEVRLSLRIIDEV